ncbi:hypothetical protein SAMN05216223_11574 [Actinacidiphila yanglinensis]|uniref:Uncharacterized protein n=1 Tax=Actinacidiphila yanglinensis TaxID=310779 RepID=A0A1H6DGY1_9ACTN|nr:hypothetical protein [Actinacidiphila yanglinensis]SEG84431.1 hypothetical protein SAMN05216223_11574 [Actinacidiphila yanglinensis]
MYAIRLQLLRTGSPHGEPTPTDLVEVLIEGLPPPCGVQQLTALTDQSGRRIDAIAFVLAPSLLAAETAVRRACLDAIARSVVFPGWSLTRCEADFMLTMDLP